MTTDWGLPASITQEATLILADLYDADESIAPLWARRVTLTPGQQTTFLEWWEALGLAERLDGERTVYEAGEEKIQLTSHAYQARFDISREAVFLNSERSLIADPQDIAQNLLERFRRRLLVSSLEPIGYGANGRKTYTGQSLYDTEHRHPEGATIKTFSNKVAIGRSSVSSPTINEAKNELESAWERLQSIRAADGVPYEVGDMTDLTVIVYSTGVQSAYDRLRREKHLNGGEENVYHGRFRVIRDTRVTAGNENKVRAVWSAPSGERPVLWGEARPPGEVEVLAMDKREAKIPVGSTAGFAFAAGFPQTTVSIE